jgi:hypothetical protein
MAGICVDVAHQTGSAQQTRTRIGTTARLLERPSRIVQGPGLLAYGDAGLEKSTHRSILVIMAGEWLEIAQKLAQAARAGLAIERKRLNEILAERQQKQVPQSSQSSA